MIGWNEDDEITLTYRTLKNAQAESFEAGVLEERDRVLDIIAEQSCSHSGCAKCEAYEYIADRVAKRGI